jgi:plastocyanin
MALRIEAHMKRIAAAWLVLLAAGLLASSGCGGGGSSYSAPGAPSTPAPAAGGPTTTIRITAAGVSPKEVRIEIGSRVLFVNEDTRSHEVMSDPHPLHTGCPEINQVADLAPGQSRQTGAFGATRNCGFHDNRQDGVTSLRGNIIVGQAGNPSDYY